VAIAVSTIFHPSGHSSANDAVAHQTPITANRKMRKSIVVMSFPFQILFL
jgi:hypothetical protein